MKSIQKLDGKRLSYEKTPMSSTVCLCTVTRGFIRVDFEKLLLEKCVINAGPQARQLYDGVGVWFGTQCLYSSKETTELFNSTSTIVDELCSEPVTLKTCSKYAINLLRPCFKLEEQASLDIIYNVTSLYVDFMCDHKEFFNAMIGNPDECVSSTRQARQNCDDQIFSSYDPNNSTVKDPATGARTRLAQPYILGIEDCIKFKQYQHCTVNALKTCENQTVATVVESLMNSLANATPCKNLLEAQEFLNTDLVQSPVEELESLIRKKCGKNADPISSASAIDGLRSFSNCFTTLVNVMQFKAEVITAAALPGGLDTLFDNYSLKVPSLAKCFMHVSDSIEPCLEPEEQEAAKVIRNVAIFWLQNFFHDQEGGHANHENQSSTNV